MPNTYKIGIELELLATPKAHTPRSNSLEELAERLVSSYKRTAPPQALSMHNDIDGGYTSSDHEHAWTLTEDCSIDCDSSEQYAMEIVSPVFTYKPSSTWRDDARTLFSSLSNEVFLQVNESCGLHVHISPDGEDIWTLRDLKRLSRAMIYFEPAIERLVPSHRRQNFWARSNRHDNPKLEWKDNSEILQMIDQCETLEDVVSLMNNGSNRNFAWNFTNIYSGGIFTIEFRRGPGATQVNTCLQWVEFVVSLAHAAKCGGTKSELAAYTRDVEGMMHFFRGYPVADGNILIRDSLFANKCGSLKPRKIGQLTAVEEGKIRAKDEEAGRKNIIMKKLTAA